MNTNSKILRFWIFTYNFNFLDRDLEFYRALSLMVMTEHDILTIRGDCGVDGD